MKNLSTEEYNATVKIFNSFITYIDVKIERILMREGELSTSYFGDDTEAEMNRLASFTKVDEIYPELENIKNCLKKIKDGVKGLTTSGKM